MVACRLVANHLWVDYSERPIECLIVLRDQVRVPSEHRIGIFRTLEKSAKE
jgi:hypothetical protein